MTTCRSLSITPHVAMKQPSRHAGYATSQRVRKRAEVVFGWPKTVGGGRKLRYCGVARNLVRMATLMPRPASPGAVPVCRGCNAPTGGASGPIRGDPGHHLLRIGVRRRLNAGAGPLPISQTRILHHPARTHATSE